MSMEAFVRCHNWLLKCVSQPEIGKNSLKPYFGGSRSSMLVPPERSSAMLVMISYRDLRIGRLHSNRCAELQISSLQYWNRLNNTGVWSLIELASLYTVPLSAVNGLSRLTTTSNGHVTCTADSNIFESATDFRIESNLNGRFEWNRIIIIIQFL